MKIKVNGEERLIQSNKSISLNETIILLGYSSNTVVVEVNNLIINSLEWDKKYIKNGDKLEIVSIVGGGWLKKVDYIWFKIMIFHRKLNN